MISRFNDRVTDMMAIVDELSLSQSTADDLLQLFKKSLFVEKMYDKRVIAVSGLQGTGKTTLIKQLYNLDDDILPPTLGRGEMIPILITEECGRNNIGFRKHFLKKDEDGNYNVNEDEISLDEFSSLRRKYENNVFFLEILHPFEFINSDFCSILLLPGMEQFSKEDENKINWQKYISFSLIASGSCIFVLNNTAYHDMKNHEMMEFILNQFKDAKPVFVVTGCDVDLHRAKEVKNDIKAKFSEVCPDFNFDDRIILSGLLDHYSNEWVQQLKVLISNFRTPKDFRIQQLKEMRNIISESNVVLASIKSELNETNIDNAFNKLSYENDLKHFWEYKETLIKNISKEIQKVLTSRGSSIHSKIVDHIKDNISFWKKFKNSFVAQDIRDLKKFNDYIINIWTQPNTVKIDDELVLGINKALLKKFNIYVDLITTNVEPNRKALVSYSKPELLGKYDKDKVETLINRDFFTNLAVLIHGKKEEKLSKEVTIKETMEISLLLVCEMFRHQILYDGKFYKTIEEKDRITPAVEDFEALSKTQNRVLLGIAATIGIDGAVDGKIDSIPNLMNAIGLATPYGLMIMTGITAITAGITVYRSIMKYEMELNDAASSMIEELNKNVVQSLTSELDDYFEVIYERIRKNLEKYLSVNEKTVLQLNAIKTVYDFEAIKKEIANELNSELRLLA